MKKEKKAISSNYLEKVPSRPEKIAWNADAQGIVSLEVENTGFFNRAAQKLFKKPRISYIHLDEMGSFLWQEMDGRRNIMELGETVKARFGKKADPLYERLAKYVQILDSYGFIDLK